MILSQCESSPTEIKPIHINRNLSILLFIIHVSVINLAFYHFICRVLSIFPTSIFFHLVCIINCFPFINHKTCTHNFLTSLSHIGVLWIMSHHGLILCPVFSIRIILLPINYLFIISWDLPVSLRGIPHTSDQEDSRFGAFSGYLSPAAFLIQWERCHTTGFQVPYL